MKRKEKAICILWKIARFLILSGLVFVILYPLLYMISCAFRTRQDMNDPTVIWIPKHLTFRIIRQTARVMDYGNTLLRTILLNVGCSLVQVASCAMTGYGFARFRFRGRNLLFGIVILSILVPNQLTAIPEYMEFRYCFGIQPLIEKYDPDLAEFFNLIDTPLTMYLPAMMGNGIRAGLMIFIFRQSFRTIPRELEEAAALDGCGAFRIFMQIMIPNVSTSFVVVFLFSVVWYWNDYYVSSAFFINYQTIGLKLKNLSTLLSQELFRSAQVSPREQIVWLQAGCLLTILPLLLVYLCLQKYLTQSVERSGIVE